jgi:signal transduction histidine kinase/ActR/RegA family two-component response regulator
LHGSFNYDAKDNNSIPNNSINNLIEDSKKNIWISTETGICKLDYNSKKIIRFSHEYLNKNQIFRILEDNMGTIWVTTSKGLVSMRPDGTGFKIYDKNNGLLSEQFNYSSSYKSNIGDLYFGTTKGMISFNPSSFTKNNYVPPVLITRLLVNNQELNENSSSRLNKAIPYTTNISLPYDSSNIIIEIAALSYSIPNKNAFTYKMDGLDKDWTFIKNNRKIYYTKLPPGDYIFKVKGSNSEGIWNEKETELKIHIIPPLWANNWAYSFYAFLFFFILFIILRYYYIAIGERNLRNIEGLENEKERQIYNAKVEFFTYITHEIKTPLTLIKLPVEKLLNSIASDSINFEYVTMIDKNTNRLINLTNQLLDFRKADPNNYSLTFVRTDINSLLEELYVNYNLLAEKKKIEFKLELPRVPLFADVDPESFRKILNNLFNNALKYSEHIVKVRLFPFSSEDTVFKIEFKNDGFIIPFEKKEKIFEPFIRLKQTEKSAGTGIGLTLSRSLAELHKGELDLKKEEVNFNTFLLTVPIHHEKKIILGTEKSIETEIETTAEGTVNDSQKNEKNISILLVEDEKEIIDFLQKELKSDYNVFKATNGLEALDILLKENINLVISDIIMPIIDGIELCKKIKTDIEYSHIPIILLTAKNTLTSKIEGLDTGADAYIEKPFAMEYLFAQIKNLLSNRNIIKDYYAHSPLAHIRGIACTTADKTFLDELQKVID